MASDEGLNAYGAVTWGQFFIYQGFNDRAGWMHTSSGVDAIDEYLETVTKKGDGYFYKYGNEERPVTLVEDHRCRTGPPPAWRQKEFTVYRTHHGPIVREADGKWVSDPPDAGADQGADAVVHAHQGARLQGVPQDDGAAHQLVEQHDLRRRRRQHRLLPRQLHPAARSRSSTGPKPVDGSNPATEWKGVLSVDETPHLLNPASGWLYNSNNWPWSAAGP